MRISASFLAALLFTGTLGAMNTAMGADGMVSRDEFTADSYCHEKFPAIRQGTLGDDQPELKDSNTGDVVDFYGACDEAPLGQEQIQAQKLDDQHRLEMEYSD